MKVFCCVIVLSLLVALAIPGWGQIAPLYGKVVGEDGKPLANADITMVNNETGRQYIMKSDKKGDFVVNNVPVGSYHITIKQDGKVVYEAPGRNIKGDADLKIDLAKERVAAKEQQMQGFSAEQRKKIAEEQQAAEKERANLGAMNQLLAQAKASSDAGDFAGAETSIKQAIQVDPSQALLWSRLGETYLGAGAKDSTAGNRDAATADYKEAAEAYQKAISLKPAEAVYHNNLGQALAKQGKAEDAAAEYTTAAQLDPANAGMYYFNLGAILTNGGKVDEANVAFDKAIAADPKRSEAYYWKGVNLLGKATTDKSGKMVAPPGTADDLRKYLELDPSGKYAASAKDLLGTIGEKVETSYSKGKSK